MLLKKRSYYEIRSSLILCHLVFLKSQAQPDLSRLGLIYEDIWCLAAGFRSIYYNCIRRSANGVAHSLARFARLLNNEIVWLEEDPPPAMDALCLDSSFLN